MTGLLRSSSSAIEMALEVMTSIPINNKPPHVYFKHTEWFQDDELRWHLSIVRDDYCKHTTKPRNCNDKGQLKPQWSPPVVTVSDFLGMLQGDEQGDGPLQLEGPINGYLGLRHVLLRSITAKSSSSLHADYLWREGDDFQIVSNELVKWVNEFQSVRATVKGPAWAKHGWSETSPGFAYWYTRHDGKRQLFYGKGMIGNLGDATVKNVVMFGHRYASYGKGSWILGGMDATVMRHLVYHVGLLLEYEDKDFTTVVELAYRNGVAGRRGATSWFDGEETQGLLRELERREEIVLPVDDSKAEVRIYDLDLKDATAFKEFANNLNLEKGVDPKIARFDYFRFPMDENSLAWTVAVSDTNKKRIVDMLPDAIKRQMPDTMRGTLTGQTEVYAGQPTRNGQPTTITRDDIAQYVLNYLHVDGAYIQKTQNCQTFAADLFTLLTEKKVTLSQPVTYEPHLKWFEDQA
eukprot:TRINITY_DN21269_c0_g2_i1.p1 TRINITY_DN21269_c0_g2~~TRINITY_DN21269_c0_g2_i1.p1  ORF type:complete len:463 (-),score=48.51 TRINITY_DN21269_c0_g2_i1:43-1431(-)